MSRWSAAPAEAKVYYIIASSGHPNYGDELIVRRWLRLLAKVAPKATVWLDCPEPGLSAAVFHNDHPGLRTTNILYRLCWDAPSDDPVEVRRHVLAALDDPGNAPRLVAGLDLLRTIDVFHIVGGGYANAIWPRHLGLVAAAEWVAAHTDAVIGVTGLGILPTSARVDEVWAAAGDSFDVLVVRDAESAKHLAGLGVRAELGPDDIFLGGLAGLFDPAPSPDFMVCVQTDLHSMDMAEVADAVRRTLREWGATAENTGFVECIPRVDRVIYDIIGEEFSHARFYPLWELLDRGFPARAGQRWISSRYHPHILAAAAGAEGIALQIKDDYYGIKHRAVREFGSRWRVATLADLVGEPGPAGAVAARAKSFSRSVLASARELYGA